MIGISVIEPGEMTIKVNSNSKRKRLKTNAAGHLVRRFKDPTCAAIVLVTIPVLFARNKGILYIQHILVLLRRQAFYTITKLIVMLTAKSHLKVFSYTVPSDSIKTGITITFLQFQSPDSFYLTPWYLLIFSFSFSFTLVSNEKVTSISVIVS